MTDPALGPSAPPKPGPAAGLRLAYVVEYYATFIVEEILELRRLGAHVVVLNAFRAASEEDPVKEALRRESLYFPPRYRGALAANLRCLLRRPGAYLSMASLLLREGDPLQVLALAAYHAETLRGQHVRHVHGTFGTRTATLAHVTSRLAGIGYSFSTHAYDIFNPNPSLVWKTAAARFMRTISRFNERFILDTYNGVDPTKVRVAYLGVDLTKFPPARAREGSNPALKRILSVGDLFPKKGHEYLVRACGVLDNRGVQFDCEIIGEGPMRAPLQQEIDRLGLGARVRLLGRRNASEVRGHLSEAHVFALACADRRDIGEHLDGIPVSLMEAMAAGLPVISTRVSGIPELIEDGASGLLVPEKDEGALAQAIERLFDDESLARSLAAGARRRIEASFDLKANTQALARLFRESESG